MQNHSNGNEFDLHGNKPVGGTHFQMNGFALRLVLTHAKRNSEMPIKPTSRRSLLRQSVIQFGHLLAFKLFKFHIEL